MDRLLQNVGELSAPARSAVEGLVGHPLRDDQQLYIVALDSAVEPTAAKRRLAWHDLQAIINEIQDSMRSEENSPDEIDRQIDEACDDVRYGK